MNIVTADSPDFERLWRSLWDESGYRHALYGPLNLRFYREYFGHVFEDRSVLAMSGEGVVAGLRVTTHVTPDSTVFSLFGRPSIYAQTRSAGTRAARDAYAAIKEYADQAIAAAGPWQWEHGEYLERGFVSAFGRHLLSLGATPMVATTQLIDLTETPETLFSELSKSFRWSVNWGRKNLAVRLVDGTTVQESDLHQFRNLHIEAAGRETRSQETWRIQYEMVREGEAFLCLGSLEGQLVTAALFPTSAEHCYYGVSASRRDLFDKPVSHVLIWTAIEHARRLGCRWFETGEIRYPYQDPPPSPKELSISTFKRGFGGATYAQLKLRAGGSPVGR